MAAPRPFWMAMLNTFKKLKEDPSLTVRLDLNQKKSISAFKSCKVLGNFTFLTLSFSVEGEFRSTARETYFLSDGSKFDARPIYRFSNTLNCVQFCVAEVTNEESGCLSHYMLEVARINEKNVGVSYHNGFTDKNVAKNKRNRAPEVSPSPPVQETTAFEVSLSSSDDSLPLKKHKYLRVTVPSADPQERKSEIQEELAKRDAYLQELRSELDKIKLELAELRGV